MIRVDSISVWADEVVKERLSWYYRVMRNIKPAKFLIAKRVSFEGDLRVTETRELWREHRRLSENFSDLWREVREGEVDVEDLTMPNVSLIDLKIELLNRMLRRCELCEWRCRVNRVDGVKKGACKVGFESRVSTWFHHMGEEAPLVTGGGSGTIFFTGCTFRCVFCQNWDISQDHLSGVAVDGRRLSIIMKRLREEGVANINLVGGEPTPNLHTILEGIAHLEVNTPILWNSNMYLTPEAMEILMDVVDIWLPDFKWGNDRCALRYSKAPRYFEAVSRNHSLAHGSGDMIIRHLIIPGHIECCTKPVLDWIAENCPRALVNIMDQYHPDYLVTSDSSYVDIDRRPTYGEIGEAYSYAEKIGIVYRPVS